MMKRFIFILSALTLLAACSSEDPGNKPLEDGDRTVMMRTMTKAGAAADTEQTPVLMFWLEGDHDKLGGESVQPYFVSRPQGVVDDYKTTPYNTGFPYPGNTVIYANGYCPSTLIAEGDGTYPWATLFVPSDMLGYIDVSASTNASGTTGFVKGSIDAPFEADNGQTMNFSHLLSRVNFYAKLGDIPAEKFFRRARVGVDGKGVFTETFRWGDNDRYAAYGVTSSDQAYWSAQDANSNQMDPHEKEPRYIGSVYIHPGQGSIRFDVSVDMSETVSFDSIEQIQALSSSVTFRNDKDNDITLEAGDEYDITITILYDSFAFEGRKAMWQDGGKIPLPF